MSIHQDRYFVYESSGGSGTGAHGSSLLAYVISTKILRAGSAHVI